MQCRACRTTSEQLGVSGVVAGPPFPCYDTPQAGYTEVESRVAASRVIRNDNIGSVCPRAGSALFLIHIGRFVQVRQTAPRSLPQQTTFGGINGGTFKIELFKTSY